ncbi:MAG: hypothetical protein EU551_02775 [Promethearchaeota archaeon]|nr:MAG: hypothetical protein EU551_02775 [Candidatus Lokiarchaeota archaeon]
MSRKDVKNLLGSVSYGVHIEVLEKIEKLKEVSMRLEFYQQRRKLREVIIRDFQALLRELTEFWEKDAEMTIYPRKMAAWLSDYLDDLGYSDFDFNYIYKLITGKLDEDKNLKKLHDMLQLDDPDVKPKLRKIDVKLPSEGRSDFLNNLIDEYLEEVPKTVQSSIYFIDEEGEFQSIEQEQEIIQDEEEKKEYSVSTSFDNPLDISLTDVQINNIIPYGYKVKNTNVEGLTEIEPEKKLLDDGLQLTWTIPEIKPKENVKIDVDLKRRISRTILMNMEDETNIINTYFNIDPYQDRFSASESFTNINNIIINHLIFEDEIPSTFNLIDSRPPNDLFVLNMEKSGFEQLIKWKYSSIGTTEKITHIYYLIDRPFFILNKYKIKSKVDDKPILSVIRLIEPNIRYKELIVSYYMKFEKPPLNPFYIREEINESIDTTLIVPEDIEKTIEIENNLMTRIWEIFPSEDENIYEFGYICSGDSIKNDIPANIYIPNTELIEVDKKLSQLEKKTFFIPELHGYLKQFQTTS